MMRALPLLLLMSLSVHADDLCRNGMFADDQNDLRPGRIIGNGPTPLYQDSTPGCPQKGPACRESEIARTGTEVLVSKVRDGFACVWQSHDVVGWAPAARVDTSLSMERNPPVSAWAGDW